MAKETKPAPVAPETLAAFQAAMCDYRLDTPLTGVPDLGTLVKPLTYVVDGAGIWEIKRTPFGVAIRKATALRGAAPVLKEGFVLGVPKIPWTLYMSIVAWFRAVHEKYRSEAYVQVWFRPDGTEAVAADHLTAGVAGGEMYLHVPMQDVSGGGVEHVGEHDKEGTSGHLHVADIHSHHTMGAFWSTTDDSDEKKHERIFGVIGQIDKPVPASKWRTAISGEFLDLPMTSVVDVPAMQQPFTVDLGALIRGGGAVDLSKVAVDPFEEATFPDTWMQQLVTEKPRRFFDGWRGRQTYRPAGFGGGSDDVDDILPILVVDRGNVERLLKLKGKDLFEILVGQDGKLHEQHVKTLH